MKAEPLTIDDKRFLINRLIKQAPTGTLVREFFKNADENAGLGPEEKRQIRIISDRNRRCAKGGVLEYRHRGWMMPN